MKVVIFSGTTEGRELSKTLAAEGAEVVVSVASEYGSEEQGTMEGVTVSEGLKDEGQIRELIRGADLVVDATHPYAVLVTANIRQACQEENVRLLRLIREEMDPGACGYDLANDETRDEEARDVAEHGAAGGPGACGYAPANDETRNEEARDVAEHGAAGGPGACGRIRVVPDTEAAAQIADEIAGASGRVLLTTGSKDLKAYGEAIDPQRLYARVLPLVQSIELCEAAGIPHRNIIAIQGPFSQELNEAVIRDYGIDVMITKESGRTGGFPEKIRACEACRIPAVVISRPQEEGLSYEAVLEECRKRL